MKTLILTSALLLLPMAAHAQSQQICLTIPAGAVPHIVKAAQVAGEPTPKAWITSIVREAMRVVVVEDEMRQADAIRDAAAAQRFKDIGDSLPSD